mgnify:CR=1 FL=1
MLVRRAQDLCCLGWRRPWCKKVGTCTQAAPTKQWTCPWWRGPRVPLALVAAAPRAAQKNLCTCKVPPVDCLFFLLATLLCVLSFLAPYPSVGGGAVCFSVGLSLLSDLCFCPPKIFLPPALGVNLFQPPHLDNMCSCVLTATAATFLPVSQHPSVQMQGKIETLVCFFSCSSMLL